MGPYSIRSGLLLIGVLELAAGSASRASIADAAVRYRGRLTKDWIAELKDGSPAVRDLFQRGP